MNFYGNILFIFKSFNLFNLLTDMKLAIDSNFNLTGVQVFVCKINDVSFKKDFKFPISISLYYSFVYENEALITFKHYNIGTGLRLKYESLCKLKLENFVEKLEEFVLDENNNDSSLNLNNINPIHQKKVTTLTFKCKECEFIAFDRTSLDEHLESHFENLKMNTYSKIKLKYVDMINNVRTNTIENHTTYKSANLTQFNSVIELKQGFALKIIKRKPFTDDQRIFLKEKFNVGLNGRKLTPESVAKEMASLYERFREEDRLKASQIKSYFSKLKREMDIHDSKSNISVSSSESENDKSDHYKRKKIKKLSKKVVKQLNV